MKVTFWINNLLQRQNDIHIKFQVDKHFKIIFFAKLLCFTLLIYSDMSKVKDMTEQRILI